MELQNVGIFLSSAAIGLSIANFIGTTILKKDIDSFHTNINNNVEKLEKLISNINDQLKIRNDVEDYSFYRAISIPSTPPPSVASPEPPEVGSSLPTPIVSALGTPYRSVSPESYYRNEIVMEKSPPLSAAQIIYPDELNKSEGDILCRDSAIENIFNEELKLKSRTREQILKKGIMTGAEPIQLLTVQPGGSRYLTNTQVDEYRKTHQSFKKLSIEDEIYLLREFSSLEGNYLTECSSEMKKEGYKYVISKVNNIKLDIPQTLYDATILYIDIDDEHFDWLHKTPSKHAILRKIASVGSNKI